RVDHLVAMPFDEVRLEDDAFALKRDRRAEMLVLVLQDLDEIGGVALGPGNVDRGMGGRRAQQARALENDAMIPAADALEERLVPIADDQGADVLFWHGGRQAEEIAL